MTKKRIMIGNERYMHLGILLNKLVEDGTLYHKETGLWAYVDGWNDERVRDRIDEILERRGLSIEGGFPLKQVRAKRKQIAGDLRNPKNGPVSNRSLQAQLDQQRGWIFELYEMQGEEPPEAG